MPAPGVADAASASAPPRASLPASLARPLIALSALTRMPPILEYTSYALGNAKLADAGSPYGLPPPLPGQSSPALPPPSPRPAGSPTAFDPVTYGWHKLQLVHPMDGGANEAAFILTHVEIEAHGPRLVQGVLDIVVGCLGKRMDGCGKVTQPPPSLTTALQTLTETLRAMRVSMLKMFAACDPRHYEIRTRPYIFGYAGNVDLPQGMLFEGVTEEDVRAAGWQRAIVAGVADPAGVRLQLRGETGAQSTLIPTLDILCGITHVGDTLGAMLQELEAYRPPGHREWLQALREAVWGDSSLAPGAAPGGCTGSDGYAEAVRAAEGGPPLTAPSGPGDIEAAHALRIAVRAGGAEAVRAFNTLVQGVWSFRAIHVAYSELYISRVTARVGATGGTPYRAYLRKHRDESRKAQVWNGPEGPAAAMLHLPFAMDGPQADAELDEILRPGATGCAIPHHLAQRHAAEIAAAACPSLSGRCW
jgi:indoleamine 2,3-dioxygenase